MVKCVVSGCPNRIVSSENRGIFNRPPKRFFKFPKDPARVKVWLAALRETDEHDPTEQHFICEDHFLPEDISRNEVSSDAIPIMPPCVDGGLSMMGSWGPDMPEEEDEQWTMDGDVEDEDDPPTPVGEPASAGQVGPSDAATRRTSEPVMTRVGPLSADLTPKKAVRKHVVPVGEMLRRFLELMLASPDNLVDIRKLLAGTGRSKKRIDDITDVLEDISLIEKLSDHKFKWIGKSHIANFLWKNRQVFQAEMENLKLVESVLDGLIKSCSQQLFEVTDNLENAALAYVTLADISRLKDFQQQTVMVVKAPEETKLEVPAPKEDSIQVHLKAEQGPVVVLTCEVGTGEDSSCFLTLEESRIRTTELHTEAPERAVQSA
ncbi:transcription factor E2F2 isoform X1 [Takifugu flavidus]|uniref:transcription factor E2F2 isoform X1 n=1 Tax=Takifugu flavidus TaxID=433684 RepID=UPI002544A706|nr:transcription factor E2F2 isoform X1 [Takifugu flavidus]